MKNIKSRLIKLIYSSAINKLLRPLSWVFYKLFGRQLIAISGSLKLNVVDKRINLLTNQTCSVTNALYYESPIKYEFTPIFIELIKSTSVFYDIGANIGYFSILAKKFNPNVKVIAFEPNQGVYSYLLKNISLNEISVTPIKAAVSNQNGQLEFHSVINPKYPWIKENLSGSHSLQNKYGIAKEDKYLVDVTTLSKVTNDHNIENVDLLKLDTECTEHIILENSIDFINHHKPIIICEVYHEIMTETIQVLSQLESYQTFQCFGDSLMKVELNSIKDSDPERNFFFCPESKIDRIAKFIV